MRSLRRHLHLKTRQIGMVCEKSSATVSYWLRKEGGRYTGRVAPQPKNKAAVESRRRLVVRLSQKKTLKNGRQYLSFGSTNAIKNELEDTYQINVSRETVRQDLQQAGLRAVVRPRVTTVQAADYWRRLQFAEAYVHRDSTDFVFCDEKLFSTNDFTSRKQWIWPGETPLPRERKRWPTARVMVWAAIGYDFRTIVVFPEKRKVKDRETGEQTLKPYRLTAEQYVRRCLPKIVDHVKENGLEFVQDGAGPHAAQSTMSYLERKEVKTAEWPPRSPDLNPIETLWAWMQPLVSHKHPQTFEDLCVAVKEVFDEIPQHRIDGLVESFDVRLQRCIDVKGQMISGLC